MDSSALCAGCVGPSYRSPFHSMKLSSLYRWSGHFLSDVVAMLAVVGSFWLATTVFSLLEISEIVPADARWFFFKRLASAAMFASCVELIGIDMVLSSFTIHWFEVASMFFVQLASRSGHGGISFRESSFPGLQQLFQFWISYPRAKCSSLRAQLSGCGQKWRFLWPYAPQCGFHPVLRGLQYGTKFQDPLQQVPGLLPTHFLLTAWFHQGSLPGGWLQWSRLHPPERIQVLLVSLPLLYSHVSWHHACRHSGPISNRLSTWILYFLSISHCCQPTPRAL